MSPEFVCILGPNGGSGKHISRHLFDLKFSTLVKSDKKAP